jgi:hypothetical protein
MTSSKARRTRVLREAEIAAQVAEIAVESTDVRPITIAEATSDPNVFALRVHERINELCARYGYRIEVSEVHWRRGQPITADLDLFAPDPEAHVPEVAAALLAKLGAVWMRYQIGPSLAKFVWYEDGSTEAILGTKLRAAQPVAAPET